MLDNDLEQKMQDHEVPAESAAPCQEHAAEPRETYLLPKEIDHVPRRIGMRGALVGAGFGLIGAAAATGMMCKSIDDENFLAYYFINSIISVVTGFYGGSFLAEVGYRTHRSIRKFF